ncbi:sialoadhesin [Heliangelus exortis]|uniref:sialoadhesin n=1 Tax=Heliangelus exortis TaxID=472823 RepID=UPI003A8D90A5
MAAPGTVVGTACWDVAGIGCHSPCGVLACRDIVPTEPPRDPLLTSLLETEWPPGHLPVLQEATQEDEGEYECQASSPLGSTHASLPLHVLAVRVVMRPSAEVAEGTEVTLTCRAQGAPPGTLYSWFKDGQWLGEGPDPSLALPATRRTDAGVYGCQVGRGLLRGPPAALRVLYAPQDLSFTSLLGPRGGHRPLLLCTVDSDPPSHLTLHRRDVGPPLASSRGSADPHLIVQAIPNTLRVGLGAPGGWEGGVYVCRANNSQGSVAETLHLQPPGVTVTVEPSPEVPEGTRATVTCWTVPWVGDEANYTWYKNNRWLREGPSHPRSSSLSLSLSSFPSLSPSQSLSLSLGMRRDRSSPEPTGGGRTMARWWQGGGSSPSLSSPSTRWQRGHLPLPVAPPGGSGSVAGPARGERGSSVPGAPGHLLSVRRWQSPPTAPSPST